MSSPKPYLFISHATWSREGSPRSREVLKQLYETLKDDWDVFVDRERLNPGDRWRPIILQHLAQAGIILFDKRAVEVSCWVHAEALIFCFRKSIDPGFQLIPVLLDDLTLTDTCFKDYEPFELNAINVVEDAGAKPSVEELAGTITKNLDPQKARAAAEESQGWTAAFEGLIAGLQQQTLIRAWCALTESAPQDWHGAPYDARMMKRALAQLMHMHPPLETIEAVSELIKEALDKARMEVLFKGKCVENESVELVFNSARNPEKFGLLTYLTCEIDGLAPVNNLFERLKIERPRKLSFKHFTVSEATAETEEAMVSHVENTIKGNLKTILKITSPDPKVKIGQPVRKYLDERTWLFLCYIPPSLAKMGILKILRDRYKQIVFLVHLKSDEDVRKFEAIGGKLLTPPFDEEKRTYFELLADELSNFNIHIDS